MVVEEVGNDGGGGVSFCEGGGEEKSGERGGGEEGSQRPEGREPPAPEGQPLPQI